MSNYPYAIPAPAAGSVVAASLADALADKLWTVVLTQAAAVGDKITVTATVKDVQGNTVAAATQLVFKPASFVDGASYLVSDEGAGTGLTTSSANVSAFLTSAAGVAQVGFTDAAAETIVITFETPLGPVVIPLLFT